MKLSTLRLIVYLILLAAGVWATYIIVSGNEAQGAFNTQWWVKGLKGTGAGDTLSYWKLLDSLLAKTDTSHTLDWVEGRRIVNDSLQANWATFVAGGASVAFKDSIYKYDDTCDAKWALAALADSSAGGAARATLAADVDTMGTRIRAALNEKSELGTAIELAEMAANSVDSTKIVDGGIGQADLSTGVVNSAKIGDGTIAAADLGTGSVITGKLADSVTILSQVQSDTGRFAFVKAKGTAGVHIGGDYGGFHITSDGRFYVITPGQTALPDTTFTGYESDTARGLKFADIERNVYDRITVQLTNVHQPRYVRAANDTLFLENARADTPYVWMIVGGAVDAKGSHLMTGTVPEHMTQLDSLVIAYQTSSATTTTSAIDSIQVFTTSAWGITPAWQASYTTATASVTQATFAPLSSTDADFDPTEKIIVKFYTVADANEWVGCIQATAVFR